MNLSCKACVYGTCMDNICVCDRGFFDDGGLLLKNVSNSIHSNQMTNFIPGESCNTSIADHFPIGWLTLQIIFSLLYLSISVISCVYLCRLGSERRRRTQKQRSSWRRKDTSTTVCTLRTIIFLLSLFASLTRCVWIAIDPRGARFLLHVRMTAETMEPLRMVRAYDYLLLSWGYACFFSMNTEISSFWVRVSIRFRANDSSDRKWICL